jgi:hypothetical protein
MFLLVGNGVSAQAPQRYVLDAIVIDGDTVPVVTLGEALVISDRAARSNRYQRKWDKLMRNTVKVYPLARLSGKLLQEYERELQSMKTEAERSFYMKKAEESLKAEFEGEVKNLTVSQGHVLIKLIDRETGKSSYQLIKELRSGFTAFMWQTVAVVFGSNLKDEFDPENNESDRMIEEIVQMIESGQIPVAERTAKTPEASRKMEKRKERMEKQRKKELNKAGVSM